ncbi:hypothetical protein HZA98_02440 [Candidatus Woesearchaeota archaeon]|nr:hypothetical protein [Candidatus Woesearchaeota archaeon]
MSTYARLNGEEFNYQPTPLGIILERIVIEGSPQRNFYSRRRGGKVNITCRPIHYFGDRHKYRLSLRVDKTETLVEAIREPTKEVLDITPKGDEKHILITRDRGLDRTLVSVVSREGKTLSRKAFWGINEREDISEVEIYIRSLY